MRIMVLMIALYGFLACAPKSASDPFVGVWDIATESGPNEGAVWTVTKARGEYSIEVEMPIADMLGEPASVDVQFDGENFTLLTTFEVPNAKLTVTNVGVIKDGRLEGTVTIGDSSFPVAGTRR
jgi:hypothetical protein